MDRLEEALHRVASWEEAYPLSAFPEPSGDYYRRAREVLEANGMTLDRIAAASMRHVVTQIAHIARRALYEGDDRESR
jgi:predicted nucleic acid-binding protein